MVWPFFSSAPQPEAVDETFECDYDRDCSTLYKAIESAVEPNEFDPIVKFLDTGYWSGSFFTDPISPAEQAKTWVTRFDPDDATKVMWSQLPIHLSIVCSAPPAVVGRLVKLFPEGLRCTDDQHMLPLHLALRHNASDEIVAFLLMQFPDAVNASGKSGRNAVECALRAKNKLRGKILEIFVEKSKGKMSSAIVKEHQKIKSELTIKDEEIISLRDDLEQLASKFEAMKELKGTVENDLLKRIQELETARTEQEAESADKIERLNNEKMLELLEHQKKYELLEATIADIQASESQAKTAEKSLRKELDGIHRRVAKSRSASDWESLKIDVGGMEAFRLQCSHTEAKTQIDQLKGELTKTIMEAKKTRSSLETTGSMDDTDLVDMELETDLQLIRESVSRLENKEESARTADELNTLRNEVETLRNEMKERTGSNRTKLELTILKKAMETELRNSQGKTEDELNMLRKAVSQATKNKLDNKTNAELVSLKMDLEMLKRQTKNKELVTKTKTDLSDLHNSLDQEISNTTSKQYRSQLLEMKKNAELLNEHLENPESTESILLLKKSVDHMKDVLKKKNISMKILEEVSALKNTVETDLKKSEGKTQEELLLMKKQIKSLTEQDLASKDVDELVKIKTDLADAKIELQEIEEAANIQQELENLKKTLSLEMKNTSSKADKELAMMKKAVDEVNMEQKESKNLKKSLTEEIKDANKKTERELLEMKKALDRLDVKKLESKNKEGWEAIRNEMNALKQELEAKQGNKDLASEIESIKKVVAGLSLEKMSTTESDFNTLRADMDAMRNALKQKDEGEAELKKQLDQLRRHGEAKKKNGLSKFFTRHFTNRKINDKVSSSISVPTENVSIETKSSAISTTQSLPKPTTTTTEKVISAKDIASKYAESNVTTIAPPSMKKGYSLEQASSDDSSDDEVVSHSTGQVLAKLSETFIDDVPAVETVHTEQEEPTQSPTDPSTETVQDAAAVKAKFLSMPKITISRKVQSMDARIESPRKALSNATTVLPIRTVSKVIEEESDVIETVDTLEDDVLVPTPTPSQIAGTVQ